MRELKEVANEIKGIHLKNSILKVPPEPHLVSIGSALLHHQLLKICSKVFGDKSPGKKLMEAYLVFVNSFIMKTESVQSRKCEHVPVKYDDIRNDAFRKCNRAADCRYEAKFRFRCHLKT